MEQVMEDIIPKIKLSNKTESEKMQPLLVDHENHPSLQVIIDAFENSDKVTLGYSTLEKDGTQSKPSLKKKLLYLTGSSLRDHLFNKTFQKYELVTNATPEVTRMILRFFRFGEIQPNNKEFADKYSKLEKTNNNPNNFCVGKWDSHGNEMGFFVFVRNQKIEINTLDKNKKYLLKETPLRSFTNSIYEDAESRDFSINSMYLKLKNSNGDNTELYDPMRRGVHDVVHNEIYLVGNHYEMFKENPSLMFNLAELSSRFCEDHKLYEGNVKDIKESYSKVNNLPKLFKQNYINAINNEDVPTYYYLRNLFVSGLLFKLFPKLKLTPPHIGLFDDYLFITAYLLQNNHDGFIFNALINLEWHKFEIKEILFIKSLIDWAKTNDESMIEKSLSNVTDISISKTIKFMKIFDKEKEFKKLLEKYSIDVL